MKIGIAGAGAMGTMFAFFLGRAGADWVIYEKSPGAASALERGITVRFEGTAEIIKGTVSTEPGVLGGCGIVFLFVKSYSTGEAVATIAPILAPGAIVVSLQNGLGNAETISREIGDDRLVYGSTVIGAARTDAHTVVYGGGDRVTIGGKDAAAVTRVKALLDRAGLAVTVSARPDEAVWRKAVINAAINPLGALLGVPNGSLVEIPHARALQEIIVAEAAAVARARGLALDAAEMAAEAAAVCASTAGNLCSMLQDVRAGRRTEIDAINGAIAAFGEESGVPVPCNRTLALLVRALESAAGMKRPC